VNVPTTIWFPSYVIVSLRSCGRTRTQYWCVGESAKSESFAGAVNAGVE